MAFINLTPHPITLIPAHGVEITVPPSGQVARVESAQVPVSSVLGFPISTTCFGGVVNLPGPVEGFTLIVSGMVAQALKGKGRTDVVAPDTGLSAERDGKGQIIGVRGFVVY